MSDSPFLVALLQKTKSTSTLLNPTTLTGILNATKDKMVIDSGLSPLALVRLASNMSGSNIHFHTLPATPSASPSPSSSTAASSTTSTRAAGSSAVAATGGGRTCRRPTALTDLPAVGVPCVK